MFFAGTVGHSNDNDGRQNHRRSGADRVIASEIREQRSFAVHKIVHRQNCDVEQIASQQISHGQIGRADPDRGEGNRHFRQRG